MPQDPQAPSSVPETAAAPSSVPAPGAAGGDQKPPRIDDFVGAQPTKRLRDWAWLWEQDAAFPIRTHRGLLGRLGVAFKRLLRPLVAVPQRDLWDRQRVWNLVLLEHLQAWHERLADLDGRYAPASARLDHLEALLPQVLEDARGHNDALYALVDQKLERHRREVRDLLASLGAALARSAADGGTAPLRQAVDERAYVEFERRHRGTQEEVRERIAAHLPRLAGRSPLLDLGCGRGEALEVFTAAGIAAQGVDSSAEMVAVCRAKGLEAETGDLLDALAGREEGSLAAVVSFHVVEHLPPAVVERLVRLAWRALRPGGLLLLETPNPLSLVVAARNFWLDPTHLRPVHPEWLRSLALACGFESAEVEELHAFSGERLPEVRLEELAPEQRVLADRVNRLRDTLDDLLYGHQDYVLAATKGE